MQSPGNAPRRTPGEQRSHPGACQRPYRQPQQAFGQSSCGVQQDQARLAQVQGTINTLTGALSSVMNSLNKQMSEQDLSSEQRAKITSLIAKYAS